MADGADWDGRDGAGSSGTDESLTPGQVRVRRAIGWAWLWVGGLGLVVLGVARLFDSRLLVIPGLLIYALIFGALSKLLGVDVTEPARR